MTEVTGYHEQELLGSSITALIAEELMENTAAPFERALRGSTEAFETWLKHLHGHKIQVHVKNIPIIIDGVLDGVYSIVKDILRM